MLLKKCLYGLPQAFKYFDEHISSQLLAMGFTRCVSDAEVFILSRGVEHVILSKHVDDCLLVATRGSELLKFVSGELEKSYYLTTSIEPSNFVGLAMTRDRPNRSITISQPHFVGKIIDLYSAPSSTAIYPMSEDFLTSIKTSSTLSILSPDLQTLFQEKLETSYIYLLIPVQIFFTPQLNYRGEVIRRLRRIWPPLTVC